MEGDPKLQGNCADIDDVIMECIFCFCAPGKGKKRGNEMNLHVGRVDGMSCQQSQVMMTNLPFGPLFLLLLAHRLLAHSTFGPQPRTTNHGKTTHDTTKIRVTPTKRN